jgi:hypothetical protein
LGILTILRIGGKITYAKYQCFMELKKLNRQNPGGGRHRFGDLGADVETSLKLLVTESDYVGAK